MTSIAYTNLRKEPGMDVLPRWVELVRSDKKRAARMTGQELRCLVLAKKLRGWENTMVVWANRTNWEPFDRRHLRKLATGFPELPF